LNFTTEFYFETQGAFTKTLFALLLSFYLYRSLDVKQRQNDSNSANSVTLNHEDD